MKSTANEPTRQELIDRDRPRAMREKKRYYADGTPFWFYNQIMYTETGAIPACQEEIDLYEGLTYFHPSERSTILKKRLDKNVISLTEYYDELANISKDVEHDIANAKLADFIEYITHQTGILKDEIRHRSLKRGHIMQVYEMAKRLNP